MTSSIDHRIISSLEEDVSLSALEQDIIYVSPSGSTSVIKRGMTAVLRIALENHPSAVRSNLLTVGKNNKIDNLAEEADGLPGNILDILKNERVHHLHLLDNRGGDVAVSDCLLSFADHLYKREGATVAFAGAQVHSCAARCAMMAHQLFSLKDSSFVFHAPEMSKGLEELVRQNDDCEEILGHFRQMKEDFIAELYNILMSSSQGMIRSRRLRRKLEGALADESNPRSEVTLQPSELKGQINKIFRTPYRLACQFSNMACTSVKLSMENLHDRFFTLQEIKRRIKVRCKRKFGVVPEIRWDKEKRSLFAKPPNTLSDNDVEIFSRVFPEMIADESANTFTYGFS